jgi:hypothetical protein
MRHDAIAARRHHAGEIPFREAWLQSFVTEARSVTASSAASMTKPIGHHRWPAAMLRPTQVFAVL